MAREGALRFEGSKEEGARLRLGYCHQGGSVGSRRLRPGCLLEALRLHPILFKASEQEQAESDACSNVKPQCD